MAVPDNDIKILATDSLGSDGYTNKEEPDGLINTEGYGKQSLSYQQFNYLMNNFGKWLEYLYTEFIPDLDTSLQDQVDTINNTTIPDESTTRSDEDAALRSTTGTANGDTDMGAFTGTTLGDNESTKAGMQKLGTALDTVIYTTIPDEITAREDADTTLQDQFDALNSRTYQDFTASRVANTTYTNSESYAIEIMISAACSSSTRGNLVVNGLSHEFGSGGTTTALTLALTTTVPPGGTYAITSSNGTPTINTWSELR